MHGHDIERWREDPDTLVVKEAGQVLYRLGKPPQRLGHLPPT
jgi:hypothetical protein